MEFLGKFTSTVRLDWKLWLLSLAMGLFRLVISPKILDILLSRSSTINMSNLALQFGAMRWY